MAPHAVTEERAAAAKALEMDAVATALAPRRRRSSRSEEHHDDERACDLWADPTGQEPCFYEAFLGWDWDRSWGCCYFFMAGAVDDVGKGV
jgi:hypothetical protein